MNYIVRKGFMSQMDKMAEGPNPNPVGDMVRYIKSPTGILSHGAAALGGAGAGVGSLAVLVGLMKLLRSSNE